MNASCFKMQRYICILYIENILMNFKKILKMLGFHQLPGVNGVTGCGFCSA